jgi:hypothetical protein
MPVTLAELQQMSQPKPPQGFKGVRGSGPKMTMIEDIFKRAEQNVQAAGEQRFYHDINPSDPRAVFMKKADYPGNTYSSDWTIPAMHQEFPEPPAQRFVQAAREAFPDASVVYDMQGNPIHMPRTISEEEAVARLDSKIQQYSSFTTQPPYAGAVPKMKNATEWDKSVYIGDDDRIPQTAEPFRHHHRQSAVSCDQIMNHIQNCEMCQRYFQVNSQPYLITIGLLVVLFLVVLFFLLKKPSYYY